MAKQFGQWKGYDRTRKESHASKLTDPVVIVRVARTPDDHVGFNRTFTVLHKAWSTKPDMRERRLEGENSDPTMTHTFTIRTPGPGVRYETRDAVVWGNRIFGIILSDIVGDNREWMRLITTETDQLDSASFASIMEASEGFVIATETGNPLSIPAVVSEQTPPENPYWPTEG